MSFGASTFGALPYGSTNTGAGHVLHSLGYIVNFGAPWVASFNTYHDLASLGCVTTFGDSFVGAGSVFRMSSLGVITRFGTMTTVGDVSGSMESLGYVMRFGKLSAIKFKRRPEA